MNGQVSCEGPLGKTSLTSPQPTPGMHMRPDDELIAKVKPEDVKLQMGD